MMHMIDPSPTQEIDAIVQKTEGWRGGLLAQLRAIILGAGADVTEEVKWKKPSRPEGVAVWSHYGNVCMADILKNAVRLTFPKGAQLQDSKDVFNTRLDSKTVRAVDFYEGAVVDEAALAALICAAANLNASTAKK